MNKVFSFLKNVLPGIIVGVILNYIVKYGLKSSITLKQYQFAIFIYFVVLIFLPIIKYIFSTKEGRKNILEKSEKEIVSSPFYWYKNVSTIYLGLTNYLRWIDDMAVVGFSYSSDRFVKIFGGILIIPLGVMLFIFIGELLPKLFQKKA